MVDRLCRFQGDHRDFRGAVQAEGKAHCADSAVDVELHSIEAVVPFRIFLPEWRQNERAKKWQTNLASVGVAREHEINEVTAGMGHDGVGVVGLVSHEDDRTVGLRGDCEIEVGSALTGIVDAAEPETITVALDGEVAVDENWCASAGKRLGHHRRIDDYVMIAEDGVA